MNFQMLWAFFLGCLDIGCFLYAGYLYWHDDLMKATFFLALSISMESSCVRAFKRIGVPL